MNETLGIARQSYDSVTGQKSQYHVDKQAVPSEINGRLKTPGTLNRAGHVNTDDLVEALETVLTSKAYRFINNLY